MLGCFMTACERIYERMVSYDNSADAYAKRHTISPPPHHCGLYKYLFNVWNMEFRISSAGWRHRLPRAAAARWNWFLYATTTVYMDDMFVNLNRRIGTPEIRRGC